MAPPLSLTVNRARVNLSRPALLALALLSALPLSDARAAGGGTEYVFLGAGAGSLRPRRGSPIRLVAEDLSITLRGASRKDRAAGEEFGYSVRSKLRLSNRGRAQPALYAVPIVLPAVPEVLPPQVTARAVHGAETVASTVRITVGGVEHRCTFHPEPTLPPATAPSDVPPVGNTSGEIPSELAGYCVATLAIPAGSSEVTVAYSAPLFGVEESAPLPPECGKPGRHGPECSGAPERRGFFAYYPFGAAASWAGQPDRISVTVDLGGFTLDRPASTGVPESANHANGVLQWTWNIPAPEGRDVMVVVTAPGGERTGLRDASPLRTLDSCRLDAGDVKATASSGEPDADASRAVDGSGATGWCVSRRQGVGEWIELRFDPSVKPDHLKTYGLYVLPGLGGSQRVYEAHGRVKRIRYGPCGKGARTVAELPVRDGLFEAMAKVPGSERVIAALLRGAKGGEVCLRVEIAGVVPAGNRGDACIGELALPMRCR
jgi:hypothetical protein